MTQETMAKRFCKLIVDYWTPERIALWHEYEKTDRSLTWREFEDKAEKESDSNADNS